MDVQLARGFGKVQAVVEERFDGVHHFIIEQSGGLAVEDHGVVACAHIHRYIVQEALQKQIAIGKHRAIRMIYAPHIDRAARFFVGLRNAQQIVARIGNADIYGSIVFGHEVHFDGSGVILQFIEVHFFIYLLQKRQRVAANLRQQIGIRVDARAHNRHGGFRFHIGKVKIHHAALFFQRNVVLRRKRFKFGAFDFAAQHQAQGMFAIGMRQILAQNGIDQLRT